jgi:hypothetical protein
MLTDEVCVQRVMELGLLLREAAHKEGVLSVDLGESRAKVLANRASGDILSDLAALSAIPEEV